MKKFLINDMVKGWFVGNFSPSALTTDACEVAVKHYVAGESEVMHFHKIATEVTAVISGKILMVEKEWSAGDVIVLSPGECTEFKALSDSVTVVVKIPGAVNDKYISE